MFSVANDNRNCKHVGPIVYKLGLHVQTWSDSLSVSMRNAASTWWTAV